MRAGSPLQACFPYEGNYVKDLSCMGRELAHTIIIDNSPHSYVFHPANALPISTFIDNLEVCVCVCVCVRERDPTVCVRARARA